jgi:hypothetical protein
MRNVRSTTLADGVGTGMADLTDLYCGLSGAAWLDHGGVAGPEDEGPYGQCAECQEGGAVAVGLCEPATECGAEGGTDTSCCHRRALADVDSAGAVEGSGYEAGDGDTLQAGADAVQDLNGEDAPACDEIGGDQASHWQGDE